MLTMTKRWKKDQILASYTTMRVGGAADYLFIASSREDLQLAVKEAVKMKLPLVVLGQGSNVVIADSGFRGLVIINRAAKFFFEGSVVRAESGASLARIVIAAREQALSGLEGAAGIPGTVGGAVYGNAGTKEWSMGQIVTRVKYLDPPSLEIKEKSAPTFAYRESEFKGSGKIILQVELELKKGQLDDILAKTKKQEAERKNKYPLGFPSAGSVFKNPRGESAGALIEKCGLKGYSRGGAQISPVHANFIVNNGGATAQDVYELTNIAKEKVREQLKIELEEENVFIGFDK